MFTKLTHSVLALAAVTSLFACAGTDGAADDGEDDMNVSEDELTSYAAKLAGTYTNDSGNRPPTFEKLVLKANRSFELDIDTGIRCVRAPCPSHQHIVGTYRVGSKNLYLDSNAERPSSSFYGVYPYTLTAAGKLTLRSRSNAGWTNTLKKDVAIVPADVTRFGANSSGGFVRPGPTGSECGLSQQAYTVDVATRKFTYLYCDGTTPNAPYKKITGSLTLTAAQLAKVVAANKELKITTDAPCGADKPFNTVDVTTPRGTTRYYDDFYSCQGGDRIYVDNIGAPIAVYRTFLPLR